MHSNWLSLCLNFVCLSVSHVMGKSAMISCFLPSLYWNHFRLIIRRSSIFQIQWKLDWKGMLCVCCVARSFISQAWISDSKKLRVAKSKWEVCYAFKSKLLYWWGGNLPHLCIWLVRYRREKFEEMMMSCLLFRGVIFIMSIIIEWHILLYLKIAPCFIQNYIP